MPLPNNPFSTLSKSLNVDHLRAGSVIYKYCDFTNPSKYKYLLVASVDPQLLVLVINSKINEFYFHRNLQNFHVVIPVQSHSFLIHDSYADCVAANTVFDISEIREDITTNYSQVFKGWLTDECLERVYYAVKDGETIRIGQQKQILSSIEKRLPHLSL